MEIKVLSSSAVKKLSPVGGVLHFDKPSVTIGRKDENFICIDHMAVLSNNAQGLLSFWAIFKSKN